MTREEFDNKIKTMQEEFNEEEKRWNSLELGDIVWVTGCYGGFEIDYFALIVKKIDIKNKTLDVFDTSLNRESKYSNFSTCDELVESGIDNWTKEEMDRTLSKIYEENKKLIDLLKKKNRYKKRKIKVGQIKRIIEV